MAKESAPNQGADVVRDRAVSRISDLWTKEDYWAIWLGFFLLALGLIIYLPQAPQGMSEKIAQANATLEAESERAPFKTIEWYQAVEAKKKLKATSSPIGKSIKTFTAKPHGWTTNPLDAFYRSEAEAEALNQKAMPRFEAASGRRPGAGRKGPGCGGRGRLSERRAEQPGGSGHRPVAQRREQAFQRQKEGGRQTV